jgi:P-type Cu+ transporter
MKNSSVIEALSKVNTIVFDKTGTLTHSSQANVLYEGEKLNDEDINMIYSLVKESVHPLSRIIKQELISSHPVRPLPIVDLREIAGKGVKGFIKNKQVRIGSWQFVEEDYFVKGSPLTGEVHISIDGIYKGYFKITNQYREGVTEMIGDLSPGKYALHVLSGDNDAEKAHLQSIFGNRTTILFHQSPQEKLNYINSLKNKGEKVLMLGDGLNDAGALKQSDVGIAVSENSSQFTPACDAIMDSRQVSMLYQFIRYARSGRVVITVSFILSILYNIAGVGIAVQGLMSPLIAAILMPVSSISIVTFVTLATSFSARRKGL